MYSSFCYLLFSFVVHVLASSHASTESSPDIQLRRRAFDGPAISRRQNASEHAIQHAEMLIAEAVAQQSAYNTWRVANPRRNTYRSKHGPNARTYTRLGEATPPMLNETIRTAAAMLAERDAVAKHANGTLHKTYSEPKHVLKRSANGTTQARRSNGYWVSDIDHNGLAPMGSDSSYPVYRDVTNPIFAGGAKGDGLHDDTAAINAAIAFGNNCGFGCESSSIKGTLIFFPPGIYLISSPINAYYYSQLVGDPNDLPIIVTSRNFISLGAIQSDVYIPNDGGIEWYIEQSNFYRQVRNFIIDISSTITDAAAGLHWQVAQATSLTNVKIYGSTAAGNTQMGMYTENGSGGFMSDVYIFGGKYGIYGGNQQYTVRSFTFEFQTTAGVCLLWDWGWTWSGLVFGAIPIGILLVNPLDPTGQQAGAIYLMDSHFMLVDTMIEATFGQDTILETSIITLDNIAIDQVKTMVKFTNSQLLDVPLFNIDFILIGNAQLGTMRPQLRYAVEISPPSPNLLSSSSTFSRDVYYTKSRPQYESLDLSMIINVKNHGARGDGSTDDTAAIIACLAMATTSNLIYFPSGSYIITSTIVVPPHTRMTGEVWSQLVASGPFFKNMADPKPMIKVGIIGDVGTVEISDLLFTSIGALPGLILMEWNVQAEIQGSVGIWDAHFRVGGAFGTNLQVAQCPKEQPIQPGCIAANMMLHITSSADGYFENLWAWVADHDIDDATNTQITVACARGILIESDGPTWLYGTASEHSILYQYNFYNTTSTFAGMIQTESPYFQYTIGTESPGPFSSSIGSFSNDPLFPDSSCTGTALLCNFAWAVIVSDTSNLTIAGAGLYSWFDNYEPAQACVDDQNCQQRLMLDQGGNSQFYLWNLVTIGAVEMISAVDTGTVVLAKNNTQAIGHPFWSALGGYLDDMETLAYMCADNDTSDACDTPNPCDYTRSFASLDDLQGSIGSFPDICTDFYALGVLNNMLTGSLAEYTNVNSGYDSVWADYVEYVKSMVPNVLTNFMAGTLPKDSVGGPGNKFFSCTLISYGQTTTMPCPVPFDDINYNQEYKLTYTLIDAAGFNKTLRSQYGIDPSWVKFGSVISKVNKCYGGGGGPNNGPIQPRRDPVCVEQDIEIYGIPQAADNIVVPNPKDFIDNALPTLTNLSITILSRQNDLALSQWYGAGDDLLQVLSMPVLNIVQAVDSMAQAKALGEAQHQADKIKKVLLILGFVFGFLPFLDGLGEALFTVDGVFEIVAALGNVALSIQEIVNDPTSAPMAILSAFTGGARKNEADYAALANSRHGLSADDLAAIGKKFVAEDAKFQQVIERACRL